MTYEYLLELATEQGLDVREKPLRTYDGRISGNRIAIRKDMTTAEKKCTLAEEMAHYDLTVGDILDQDDTNNRKQELRARLASYQRICSRDHIINALMHGCRTPYEIAEYLEVTEEVVLEALEMYRKKAV